MTTEPEPAREKILFVCTYNLSRSRTAEVLLVGHPLYDARSAGTHLDARIPITTDLVAWADRIIVMEEHHALFVRSRFPQHVATRPLLVLGIPDDYQPMADDLIEVLRERLARHLIPRDEAAP
jgi:predicted protein tyrosine phosphatase